MTNRHPVDELADNRAEQKRLKAREDELRKLIAAGDVSLTGDQHEAIVSQVVSERVDATALRKELGDRIAPFLKTVTSVVVKVTAREVLEDVG